MTAAIVLTVLLVMVGAPGFAGARRVGCAVPELRRHRTTAPPRGQAPEEITKLNEAEAFRLVIGERADLGLDSYRGQQFSRWWKAVHPNR